LADLMGERSKVVTLSLTEQTEHTLNWRQLARGSGQHGEASHRLCLEAEPAEPTILLPVLVGAAPPARLERPVHGQGPEGEVLAVAVVAQIEDAWKPRAGVRTFRPGALRVLLPEQVVHAAQDAERVHLAGAEERDHRPRSLGRCALAHPVRVGLRVRETGFAPPAVRILLRDEPRHRQPDVLGLHVLADRFQPREHGPRPVDIIDAPPTVPGPA